jgi:putative Holliday junction resolvase
MRYLGLDVGNKRVGVAVGSSELRLATPLTVFERKTGTADAERLRALIREYEVDTLVVGRPRHSDNTPSTQEALTLAYARELETALALPVLFQDERYSTAAAMLQQRARGLSEKRGRVTVDALAAAVILQDFLDKLAG